MPVLSKILSRLGIIYRYVNLGVAGLIILFVGFFSKAYAVPPALEAPPPDECLQNVRTQSDKTLALCLLWKPSSMGSCGHYFQPNLDYVAQGILPSDDVLTLQANGRVKLQAKGRSELTGGVVLKAQNRLLTANSAFATRKGKGLDKVQLIDGVRYITDDLLCYAAVATYSPKSEQANLVDVLYRLRLSSQRFQHESNYSTAWGYARVLKRQDKQHYTLNDASFSTCPIPKPFWEVRAKHLKIDAEKGTAIARGTSLWLKGVPVFYSPYWHYSFDKQRKSGFLLPTYKYRESAGTDITVPYYWNLAPNYDLTLYPEWMSERGGRLGSEFRYLYDWGNGRIDLSYMPNDRKYKQFVIKEKLGSGSDGMRYDFRWTQRVTTSKYWLWTTEAQRVSDDYYLLDLSNNLSATLNNQLLSQTVYRFDAKHAYFQATLQDYQTLHPISFSTVNDVYALAPKFEAGFMQRWLANTLISLDAQSTYFNWTNDTSVSVPEGNRFYLAPKLEFEKRYRNYEYSLNGAWNLRYYSLSRYQGAHKSIESAMPYMSLNAKGLYARYQRIGQQTLMQTLEPHIQYQWRPYQNQTNIPLFDSSERPFSYDVLFEPNRFSGLDRFADINQISLGIESRLIEENTGQEWGRVAIGQGYQLKGSRLGLCFDTASSCAPSAERIAAYQHDAPWTPIALTTEINLPSHWSMLAGGAYAFGDKLNNAWFNLHYQPSAYKVLDVAYAYLKNGDTLQLSEGPTKVANLKQIRLSYAWPINDQWRQLAAMNYQLGQNHPMAWFAGLEYDSCCWAVRFLGGRLFAGYNSSQKAQYNTVMYLQFSLNGIGSLGTANPGHLLTEQLPGYHNNF